MNLKKVLKFRGDQRVISKVDMKLFFWDYFGLKFKHSEIFKTVISIFIDCKLFNTIFFLKKKKNDQRMTIRDPLL